MAESVGSVSVDVVPDASRFTRLLRSQVRAGDASKIGEDIGRQVAEPIGQRVSASVTESLKDVGRNVGKQGAQLGKDFGDEFAKALKSRTEAALKGLPEVKLTAESSDLDKKLAQVRKNIQELGGKRVGIDVSSDEAIARAEALRKEVTALGREIEKVKKAGGNVPLDVDTVQAAAELSGLGRQLSQLRTQSERAIRIQAQVEADINEGALASTIRTKIQSALSNLPEIQLTADSSDADRDLARLRSELSSLSGKTIGVDIDAGTALAEVRRLQTELGNLASRSPNVQVQVDAAAASAQLAAVDAEISRINGSNPTIRVDADTGGAQAQLAAMSAQAGSAGGSISSLVAIGAAIAPAIVPAAAAAAAALAAIGTGAAAGVAGIGVLALGFSGIAGAVQAVTGAQSSGGGAAASYASQQNAVANAMSSVQSAAAGLANAQSNAAYAAESAANRVVAAQQAVAEAAADAARRVTSAQAAVEAATERAAQQVTAALRQQENAERALERAQRSAQMAQERLTDARKEAQRTLEDMALAAAGGALAEKRAQLNLQRAQAEAAKTAADASATAYERADAELSVQEAQQSLVEAQLNAQRATQDNTAAQAAGVAGSQQVVAANQAIASANEQVADAERSAADAAAAVQQAQVDEARSVEAAQQSLVQAQEDGAKRVAAANAALTEAQRAQAEQQRQSAFSVAQAQQGLINAQRQLEQAQNQASTAGAAGANKVAEAMAKLSPAGREFVGFITSELIPRFNELRNVAQQGLLPGVQAGIEALLPYFPQLRTFVGDVAVALGDLFERGLTALTDPFWRDFFGWLGDTIPAAVTGIGEGFGNIAKGFAGLLKAFAPVNADIGNGLLDLTEKFANWGASLENNQGFQNFLNYVKTNGPKVWETLKSIGAAIGNLFKSAAPSGPGVLDAIKGIADAIAGMDPATLNAIMIGVIGFVGALKLLGPLVGTIKLISTVISGISIVVGSTFGIVAIAVAAFIGLWLLAYNKVDWFRTAVNTWFGLIADTALWLWNNGIKPAFDGIVAAIQTAWTGFIQPTLQAIWDFINNVLVPIFTFLWQNVIVPVWNGIKVAIDVAWAAIQVVWGLIQIGIKALGEVFTWLWHNVLEPVWQGIKVAIDVAWAAIQVIWGLIQIYIKTVLAPVFNWLWDNVIKPVWEGIKTTISTVWESGIKPILEAVGGFIKDKVAPAFKAGVDAIKTAWDAVKEVAKAPVKFIVDTVLNNGILAAYNKLASTFNVKPDNVSVALPAGFASGGLIRGRGTSTSDSILARLSDQEYVVRASAVQALGVPTLNYLNAHGRLPGFADGGLIDAATGFLKSITGEVAEILKDPAGWVTGQLSGAVNNIASVGGGDFGRMAGGAATTTVNGLTNFAGTLVQRGLDILTGTLTFDNGGYLPPGLSVVNNGTGGPEAILTDSQWNAVFGRARGGGGDGPLVSIGQYTAPTDADPRRMAEDLWFLTKARG